MTRNKPGRERLDELMRRAHASRPDLELPGQWQAGLMGDVATLGRKERKSLLFHDAPRIFAGLLFRFAGAGALLAACLLLYAHLYGPDLDWNAATMLMEQPAWPASLENLIWS